jgi:hypothetical protein
MELILNISVAARAAVVLSGGQFSDSAVVAVTAAALTANNSPSGTH